MHLNGDKIVAKSLNVTTVGVVLATMRFSFQIEDSFISAHRVKIERCSNAASIKLPSFSNCMHTIRNGESHTMLQRLR